MLLPELPTQIHHQRRLWRRLLYTRLWLLRTQFPLLWRKVRLCRSRIVLGNSAPIRLVEEPAVEFLGLRHHGSILLNTRALCGSMSEGVLKRSSGFGYLLLDSGLTLVQISENPLVQFKGGMRRAQNRLTPEQRGCVLVTGVGAGPPVSAVT